MLCRDILLMIQFLMYDTMSLKGMSISGLISLIAYAIFFVASVRENISPVCSASSVYTPKRVSFCPTLSLSISPRSLVDWNEPLTMSTRYSLANAQNEVACDPPATPPLTVLRILQESSTCV
jgi:hypothetical protein